VQLEQTGTHHHAEPASGRTQVGRTTEAIPARRPADSPIVIQRIVRNTTATGRIVAGKNL